MRPLVESFHPELRAQFMKSKNAWDNQKACFNKLFASMLATSNWENKNFASQIKTIASQHEELEDCSHH